MLKIGIIGLGFMGKMHFRCWKKTGNAKLAAVCDVDASKFKKTSGTAGNIQGAEEPLNLSGVACFTDVGRMLRTMDLDAVSICVPTYLHKQVTLQCLQAGLHVLCEKPMALTSAECRIMIAAARQARRILQIGQCIRFWPQYVKAMEIVKSRRYGKVLAATFQRLSMTPVWSWKNWMMKHSLSGGAALDLHIHDADFVQYLFGMPRAVFSRAAKGPSGGYDHIVTQYLYRDSKPITAEGGWIMAPKFGFQMSFQMILEKATLVFDCTRNPDFRLCTGKGEQKIPAVVSGDGYSREIAHFAAVVSGKKRPVITTPEQSRDSVRLIEAEKQSARIGRIVKIK